jgi:hypothetical protein
MSIANNLYDGHDPMWLSAGWVPAQRRFKYKTPEHTNIREHDCSGPEHSAGGASHLTKLPDRHNFIPGACGISRYLTQALPRTSTVSVIARLVSDRKNSKEG